MAFFDTCIHAFFSVASAYEVAHNWIIMASLSVIWNNTFTIEHTIMYAHVCTQEVFIWISGAVCYTFCTQLLNKT